MYTIEQITSSKRLEDFIRFPLRLYKGNQYFVPHLISERKRFFSSRNPLFAFTEVAYFLASDESGKAIGRITAHINQRHFKVTGEKAGFFGFFECIEDPNVAEDLIEKAEDWLRERDMPVCRGPYNFSTNEECGFLASGFDRPPGIMMPYTFPYYLDFFHNRGYQLSKTLLAYEYAGQREIPRYMVPAAKRLRRNFDVTIRPFDLKRFDEELLLAFELYNAAWEDNWGFVPITLEEFQFAAGELRQLIDPSIALVAEKDGQAIGFSLGVPDYNPVFRRMWGKLFPLGWLHFILGRNHIKGMRVVLLGVRREFRNRGVDLLLYHDSFKNGLARGYQSAEMSWILEDNLAMRRPLERMHGEVTKSYHILEKKL